MRAIVDVSCSKIRFWIPLIGRYKEMFKKGLGLVVWASKLDEHRHWSPLACTLENSLWSGWAFQLNVRWWCFFSYKKFLRYFKKSCQQADRI